MLVGHFPLPGGEIVLSGRGEVGRGCAAPVSQPPEVGQELGADVDLSRVVRRALPASSVVVGAGAALGGVLAV